MEVDPTRMCELLIGLPAVVIRGVLDDGAGSPLPVHVELRNGRRPCAGCGAASRVKERPEVSLVDLPAFGRRARLVWRKHRLVCVAIEWMWLLAGAMVLLIVAQMGTLYRGRRARGS